MAIIKCLSAKSKVGGILDYVKDKEKTDEKIISGINCNPETAKEEMTFTKEFHGKIEGRQYYHVIQSFKPGEVDSIKAHEIGKEFAKAKFEDYECVVCTHLDKDHIHNHIVINSVNKETGKMYHSTKQDLRELKQENNRICEREGLSTPEEKKNRYFTMAEIKTAEKGVSFKFRLMNDIDEAKEKSSSKEEFIKTMEKRGYSINWTDTRKYITYTMPEGNKFRDRSLPGEYSKEVMENGYRGLEEAKQKIRDEGRIIRGERAAGRIDKGDFELFFANEGNNGKSKGQSNDSNRELHDGEESYGELERTIRDRQKDVTRSDEELRGAPERDQNREREFNKQGDQGFGRRTRKAKGRVKGDREEFSGSTEGDQGRAEEDKGTDKAKLERSVDAHYKDSSSLPDRNNSTDDVNKSMADSKVQGRGKDGDSANEYTNGKYTDDAAAKAKQMSQEIIDTVAKDLPVKEEKAKVQGKVPEKEQKISRSRDWGMER